jgi:hypothetical protein
MLIYHFLQFALFFQTKISFSNTNFINEKDVIYEEDLSGEVIYLFYIYL